MTIADAPTSELAMRVGALETVVTTGAGVLPDDALARADALAGRATERLRHGTDVTVVAIAGATGSGKSSLFNALVGEEVSPVGVTRPTTAHARAAVFGERSPESLLDWLDVRHRHGVEGAEELDGLVLLDLPDHDSIVEGHRLEVDRLIELVDLMIWVLDPQKYADEALHHGYLDGLSRHGAAMLFVLNQADLVPDEGREAWAADATRLLQADGIADPVVVMTSMATRRGVDEVRHEIRERIAARDAALARIDADLRTVAAELGAVPVPETDRRGSAARRLSADLASAAGADLVADAVDDGYRHDATRAMGWPFARWMLRFRRHPLRRLQPTAPAGEGTAPPTAIPVDQPRLDLALKAYADARTGEADPAWARRGREAARSHLGELPAALGTAVAGVAAQGVGRPRWWSGFAWVQRALAAVTLTGAAWLALLAVLSYLKAPIDDLTPEIGDWPLPTILLLGGAVAGIVVALVAKVAAAGTARRRGRAARSAMEDALEDVATRHVIAPVDEELDRWGALADTLATIAGGT